MKRELTLKNVLSTLVLIVWYLLYRAAYAPILLKRINSFSEWSGKTTNEDHAVTVSMTIFYILLYFIGFWYALLTIALITVTQLTIIWIIRKKSSRN